MLVRQLCQRLFPGGPGGQLSILIFHRVQPGPDPLFPHEIDAERFERVCSWLGRWFQVLPLDEAVQRLRAGTLPAAAVAITFDDGYADNHDVALPILQRHGLNATFFVSTGFLDGGMMWNDKVIETVRACRLPSLDLHGWLDDGAVDSYPLQDIAQRRHAIDAILARIKYLEPSHRDRLADALVERAGVSLPADLMMRSVQVRALHDAGMRIGGHTCWHPILATLSDAAASAEIGQGRERLQELTGAPVTLFAYPNGRPDTDYDSRILGLVRAQGFDCAVSTSWGAARSGASIDLFQLPRFTPWDRQAWRFVLRLWRNLRTPVKHCAG
jgi:peptidoglycan/xylan/chitin deacetylase (PgdA/CDA1 family)